MLSQSLLRINERQSGKVINSHQALGRGEDEGNQGMGWFISFFGDPQSIVHGNNQRFGGHVCVTQMVDELKVRLITLLSVKLSEPPEGGLGAGRIDFVSQVFTVFLGVLPTVVSDDLRYVEPYP